MRAYLSLLMSISSVLIQFQSKFVELDYVESRYNQNPIRFFLAMKSIFSICSCTAATTKSKSLFVHMDVGMGNGGNLSNMQS